MAFITPPERESEAVSALGQLEHEGSPESKERDARLAKRKKSTDKMRLLRQRAIERGMVPMTDDEILRTVALRRGEAE